MDMTSHSDVALAITKQLLQQEGNNSNVVVSPLSIQVALSLLAAGSKGPHLDQLLSFLKSNSVADLNSFVYHIISTVFADASPCDGPRLSFANGIWVEQNFPLKPSFKHVVDTFYKAIANQVDFINKSAEVTSEVNSWVKKKTNGLITEILPTGAVTSSTILILANALYFKAHWAEVFDASKTEKSDFFLLSGCPVQVPFMTRNRGSPQYIGSFDEFKVLSLPYKPGSDTRRFSMNIFLPYTKDGLSSLIQKLDSQSGFIDRHIPKQQVHVGEFKIPKFKISFGAIEVSSVLKAMGLVLPFTTGGLLGMVDSPMGESLFVSNIFHKAFIEVNEEGTEAAASTTITIGFTSMQIIESSVDFVADHPFLYVIREDSTGTVIFTGQVLDPLLE